MPRKPRETSSTEVYHFINRGVNKKNLFHMPKDYKFYLALLSEYSAKFKIQIFHYCLMSNHTHLLVRAKEMGNLSNFGHYVQRRYAYYYSKTHDWSGQVFRKRFISLPVKDDVYLLECGRYIERNPFQARVVNNPEDYLYSSYPFYAYQNPNPLITASPAYLDLSRDKNTRASTYRFYVSQIRTSERKSKDTVPF